MSQLTGRLEEIEELWSDTRVQWHYEDFPGDFQLVKDAVAGNIGGKYEQKKARHMMSKYYAGRGEFDRAEELLHIIMDETEDGYEHVACQEELFSLRYARRDELGEDAWRKEYETYARMCFEGLLKHNDDWILTVMIRRREGAATQMSDYALLAAATYLNIFRERNVVEQLKEEERYQRELEQFQVAAARMPDAPQVRYRQECLEQLNKLELKKRVDSEMRWNYLALRWAVENDVTGMDYPRDLRGACAWANRLSERVRDYQKEYPGDILHASPDAIKAYKGLAKRYMRALELGNPAVALWVMEHPEVFEKMWDFTIPAAACIIWATHEENQDPKERKRAGEEGKKWLDIMFGTMADDSGDPRCFRKWTKSKYESIIKTKMKWRRFLYIITRQIARDYPRDELWG